MRRLRHGIRIRVGDRYLVIKYFAVRIVLLFLLLFFLLNSWQFFIIDWSSYKFALNFTTIYLIVTLILSLILPAVMMWLYSKHKVDNVRHLQHRQKIAKMIYENGWYEKSTKKASGNTSSRESISWWPKIYYRLYNGRLHIYVEISMGKYQEQLLNLEKKLESGLYCELTDKELHDGYVEYILLYDMIANRISISDVVAKDGKLKLMQDVYWEYDKLPHMLIAGGTGGGKTYFILTLIEALLRTDAVLYVLDPKNADLADLKTVMPNVYYSADDISDCIFKFYDAMMARSEEMKKMPGYKTGENYAYLGLAPHFLIFDEYVAYMEMLGMKASVEVINTLKKIVMLGRQAGFFIILACQRPDAKYLGDGIRDQFNFRVALGRMSELGYSMMFGETSKVFFLKQIKGRGYVDKGNSVISEFYTPLVPKNHDFLYEIGKLAAEKNVAAAYSVKFDEEESDEEVVLPSSYTEE